MGLQLEGPSSLRRVLGPTADFGTLGLEHLAPLSINLYTEPLLPFCTRSPWNLGSWWPWGEAEASLSSARANCSSGLAYSLAAGPVPRETSLHVVRPEQTLPLSCWQRQKPSPNRVSQYHGEQMSQKLTAASEMVREVAAAQGIVGF